MLIDSDMQIQMQYGAGWRPDPRASLALAACAGLLLCAAFLELLHKPLSADVDHRPFSLSLAAAPPARRLPARHRPANPVTPVIAVPPQLEPLSPVPDLTSLEHQAVAAVAGPLREESSNGVFLQPLEQKYDNLHRALQAPEKPGTLKQGESYHAIDGDTIVKSGGACAAEHGVQTGATPDVKTNVGFAVSCPGEYHPSMADRLAEWAKKVQSSLPMPP